MSNQGGQSMANSYYMEGVNKGNDAYFYQTHLWFVSDSLSGNFLSPTIDGSLSCPLHRIPERV